MLLYIANGHALCHELITDVRPTDPWVLSKTTTTRGSGQRFGVILTGGGRPSKGGAEKVPV